jgi:hypothetical protein
VLASEIFSASKQSGSSRNSFRDSSSPGTVVSTASFDKTAKRKSALNTSYSSEEILLQAASELQGLEGEYRRSSFALS